MRFVHLLIGTLSVLAAGAVQAGSAESPELTDPAGDVETYSGLPLEPNQAFDLLAAYVANETESKFDVAIRVADLAAVTQTDAGAVTFTLFALLFELEHHAPVGRAAREGPWTVRADYLPNNDRSMQFSLEAPCSSPDDGCTAEDRDIVGELNGSFDFEASTVWIEVPRELLESPRAGDRLTNLTATVQAQWPSYPVSWVDWDQDEPNAAFQFTVPLAASGPPGSVPPTPDRNEALPSSTSETVQGRQFEKESPAGDLVLVSVLLAILALRRRSV